MQGEKEGRAHLHSGNSEGGLTLCGKFSNKQTNKTPKSWTYTKRRRQDNLPRITERCLHVGCHIRVIIAREVGAACAPSIASQFDDKRVRAATRRLAHYLVMRAGGN